ncbi:MAG: Fic family protein [Turicibacter sp.]|nr:Fic family protein [Turicibacter sp.]
MGINYDGLFKILQERKISKTALQECLGVSSTTIAKLSKNETVSMKIIEDICRLLKCQPGDIMKLEEDMPENRLLNMLLEEKKMKLKGGIYNLTQIKFAYNSNHIEGSRLSEEQTRYIYETNSILQEGDEAANINHILETINHFQCFDYMLDHVYETLSENMIKEFHRIMKNNTSDSRLEWFNVGEYKSRPNIVGDMYTTPPAKVKGEIAKLITDYNEADEITINEILEFHYKFELIHPFQDGNGHVGRLIMFKECLKHNIMPFIIDEKHKLYYYRGLKEFDNDINFLRDTCLSAQDAYEHMFNYFLGE